MANPLPQQQLLLELLNMSGEIAIMGANDTSLLWRTTNECRRNGWVTLTTIGTSGTTKAELTILGRQAMEKAAKDIT